MEAKKISLDANSFVGKSGREYIIYPSLSTRRFQAFEQYQVETEFGLSVSGFRQEARRAYDLLNKMQFADGCTVLNNMLNGIGRIEAKGANPVLKMCALFICTRDEDQSEWDEAEAQEKIADWGEIEIAFFLNCVRRLASRFMIGSDLDSQDISVPA